MKLLENKTAMIFGVANQRSIAWGITQKFHEHGARIALSYAGPALERRVRPLAEQIGAAFVHPCDVTQDDQITAIVEKAEAELGKIDILVHAIAFADREDLMRPFVETSRAGFKLAMDISVYSFVTLTNHFRKLMNPGGSFLTLTYYGSVKVAPGYNVMGVAKAALEAATRYMAYDLGPEGLRVNAISAGPIRTLAAAGVPGFRRMYKNFVEMAPLQQNITIEDVGNAALFLCSDMAAKVTGEILYVDSGYNVMGTPKPE